jgi:hypothetical protein
MHAVEMTSDAMIYIPSFMKIGSNIQVILRLLPRQSDRQQCWYYKREGFTRIMYAVEMTSDGVIYI